MSLTQEDKKYIKEEIIGNNAVIFQQFRIETDQLRKDSEQYMGALKEGFTDQVKMLAELIKERPTRSEVVEMIQEYTPPIVRKETFRIMHTEFGPIIDELRESNKKMDKRISKLESRTDRLEFAIQH